MLDTTLDPLSSTFSIPLADPRPPRPTYPQRKLLTPSPDHLDDYILELDYTAISTFFVCPRRFENRSIHSREAAKEQSPLVKGNLFHTCEDMRLRQEPDLQKKQQDAIVQDYIDNPVSHDDFRQQDFFVNVMNQYNKRYANDRLPQKVLIVNGEPFVERAFKIELMTIEVNAPLPYPRQLIMKDSHTELDADAWPHVRNLHIIYTGKIDAVLEENGNLFVADNKTTSRGGQEFLDYFNLSFQTRGYCWAVQKILNREVLGAIVNAIIWRKETKTGKGTEFQRPTYFYSQDSLAEWEESMKAHCETIISMLVRGYFPQTSLSFRSPCSWCDYQDNCRLPRAQRPADLASDLYRDVTWNPTH